MCAMSAGNLTEKILNAVDLLRGRMDPSAYSDVLSAMLLLKWASDQPGQLEVPERARWKHVVERGDNFPTEVLHDALTVLVDSNHGILKGLFGDLDFRRRLSRPEAMKLIKHFDEIPLKPGNLKFDDVVGQAYEQVLAAFADAAGKRGGEFYTPRSVIQLMVRLARPERGQSVCDPFAGSGGMLTCAEEYVAERVGRHGELTLFAQEVNAATCGIARLNLLFHGTPDASVRCGDTLANPLHVTDDGRLRLFDRILTNPPFSMNFQREEVSFPERMRYGWTSRKADLMSVQHVLATLAPDGIGVVVTPHGMLFRGGTEADIRRALVLEDRIEAVIGIGPNVFHGTAIPACVLVLRGSGGAPRGERGVLFINAEREITTGRTRNQLDPRHVEKIATAFHERREIPHFSRVVSIEEIASDDFNLNIRRYVDSNPSAWKRLSSQALVFGGVPKAEVEAQRKHFRAFGIDVADLFASEGPGHLEFPPQGFEAAAEKIPEWAAASQRRFLSRLHGWLESERPSLVNLDARALPAARQQLMGSFRRELLPAAILDEYQLVGVFADWWAAHHDELRELSRASLRQGAGSPDVIDIQRNATVDMLEMDLIMRVTKLVSLERQAVVGIYLSWGDRYGTSLLELEQRHQTAAARLKSRLRKLGYPLA